MSRRSGQTVDMMARALRLSRRNRWRKQERIDWERELQASLDGEDVASDAGGEPRASPER